MREVAVAAILVAVVVILGALHPVRRAPVATDALGPANGEVVADYLARAAGGLIGGTDATDTDPRWALVSFTDPVTIDAVAALPGGPRVSQVLLRVPLDRVQTPLVAVAVPDNQEALRRAPAVAAGRLQATAPGGDRAARIASVSADRLLAGCACVVGVVVRAVPDQLREIAAGPLVRAVEALPRDATAGRVSVTPLLPEHVDVVAPGPDDGEP
ncbi:MAG: hypothetical protein WAW17_18930 [Rhodococcus sp. (in: high G+C Gram-positive bacteria)]|uniref:hypothetical protein n=1 Tax=Rhodococcus sp. TaxID=1831 RepID=UPI003BB11476